MHVNLVAGRALRWMPPALAALLMVATARHAARGLINDDTYFHLRFGAEFVDGSWSIRDPGSISSFATEPWVPTQWLSQVAMYATERQLEAGGVTWLAGVMIVLYVLALLSTCRHLSSFLVAVPVSTMAVLASTPALSARPQVVSLGLITLCTWAWIRTSEDLRARWWLIPLTWAWAQLHGMWTVGILIGLVAALGILLDTRSCRDLRLLLVPLASLAAAAVTPVGPRLVGAIAAVGQRTDGVTEWAAPELATVGGALALLPIGVIVILMARGPRPPWAHIALLALSVAWIAYSARSVAVGTAMAAPLLAASAVRASPRLRQEVTRRTSAGLLSMTAISLALLAALLPRDTDPTTAVMGDSVETILDDLPAETPVLNHWNEGGYFMWRFPHLDPLMHGYADTFTQAELNRNQQILQLEPGWDDTVAAAGIEFAALPLDTRLTYALRQGGWTTVARSEEHVVLRAPDPQ